MEATDYARYHSNGGGLMYDVPALVAYPTGDETYDIHQSLSGGLELVHPLRDDVRGNVDFGDRLERGAFADDPSSRGGVEQMLTENERGQRNPDCFTLPGGVSAERLLHPDPLLTDVTLDQMAQNISFVSFVVLYVVEENDITVYVPTPISTYFVYGLLKADVHLKAWPREETPTPPERFIEFAQQNDAPVEMQGDDMLPVIYAGEEAGDDYAVLRHFHTHIYAKLIEEGVQPGQPLKYASLTETWRAIATADDTTPLVARLQQVVTNGVFVEFPLDDEMDDDAYAEWSWDIQHHREFAGDLRLEYGAELLNRYNQLGPQASKNRVLAASVRTEQDLIKALCTEYGDRVTTFNEEVDDVLGPEFMDDEDIDQGTQDFVSEFY